MYCNIWLVDINYASKNGKCAIWWTFIENFAAFVGNNAKQRTTNR